MVNQILCIVLNIRVPLNFCVKRNDNQSPPCAIIRCTNFRQVIGIQHQRVRGFKVEGCFEFLLGKNRVGRAQLLHHAGIQPHALLQFCRKNHPFSFQFCHLRLDIPLTVDRQGICGKVTAVTSKDFIYDIPERTLAIATVPVGNHQGFLIHLSDQTQAAHLLHIVNQTLVTAEEQLQRLLPQGHALLAWDNRRHFR